MRWVNRVLRRWAPIRQRASVSSVVLACLWWAVLPSAGGASEVRLEGVVAAVNEGRFVAAHQRALALARGGNAEAMAILGDIYYFGWGVARSFERSLHWYELAADQESAGGYFGAGRQYLRGEGVQKDLRKAVDAFTWAGESGYIDFDAEVFGAICLPREDLRKAERQLKAFLRYAPQARPGSYLQIKLLRTSFSCR